MFQEARKDGESEVTSFLPRIRGATESIKLRLPGKPSKMSKCRGKEKGRTTMRHTLYHSDFPKQLLNLAS